jgi:hypothetical protein
MKSTKYYSFDECRNNDKVLSKLNNLTDDRKVEYEFVESDLIKIKDLSLTAKEIKELNQFLHDNDVIEDHDYLDEEEDDEDEDIYGTDDDDY